MAESQRHHEGEHIEKNKTEARQGVTLHAMRYVLGISFALVCVLMLVAYFVTI